MPPLLIAELLKYLLPLIVEIRTTWKAAHSGAEPTDAQILAEFNANIDKYLAEGAAWRAAHPRT
jgi:hypothetical protein